MNFHELHYLLTKNKHEGYNQETTLNDIALLRLSQTVELNKNVQVTCLPNPKFGSSYPPINVTAFAVG